MSRKSIRDVKVVIFDYGAKVKEEIKLYEEVKKEETLQEREDKIPNDGIDFDPLNQECEVKPNGNITLSYKKKIVALADAHPNWKLAKLRRNGGRRLKSMRNLKLWRKEIASGGTRLDKLQTISKEVFDRFREARLNNLLVTTPILQKWAMEAAAPLLTDTFKFHASVRWADHFKSRHKLRLKKITNSNNNSDMSTLEETEIREEAQPKKLVPTFDPYNLLFIPNR